MLSDSGSGEVTGDSGSVPGEPICAPSAPPSNWPRQPPPPAGPGQLLFYTIQQVYTISGDVSSFNQAAFKTSLANALSGITPEMITLTVSSASILVIARITTTSVGTADGAEAALANFASNTAAASTALGVTVEEQ